MNEELNVAKLALWLDELKQDAKKDNFFDISWFEGTKNERFSIIGGWMEGFSENYSDLICISKSDPKYAMCVKIAVNEGPYAYTDFEIMNMPITKTGEVDDTCVALEWEDDTGSLAGWLLCEWERIINTY